ncbi:exonuclease sbcCD subunit D [Paenibacillus odorifer]|uniref:Nuclease SbcCD subunit D n=1 Tax=Paenibacillus odorifer TaxID=189426 RepID=A0A1R0XDU6_9BACL|nr:MULTISPECIES: exonuclease SbcCD subunit D [Paenibacillus]ETT45422.1 DNA repair exonuclease [Paenibacillus sp. FSL H8-237]OMD33216.1 exonuclease sbcCD subunit D [Paenibacillus odorifer]OME59695.1 exonuclease sbcCD subunit D [Paenibacillus odorifer]
MKILHTADWHLGKLVQGFYMTEDQQYILEQFIKAIKTEQPDAIIIAGDLYDRAVPPTEAVQLLDRVLEKIILQLKTPVFVIAGNHDSPSRLDFGSSIMRASGLHIAGELTNPMEPVVLSDEYGEVHFHLIPYAEPGKVRYLMDDESIRTHNDAMQKITENIKRTMDPIARHIFVGHAFVTPGGVAQDNTSDSERPLSIGGAEHVSSEYFDRFHYTALGHLHQAHHVGNETVRYAGSPLKYSISEEHHNKGYLIVHLDQHGNTTIERKLLTPRRDMRTVEGFIADIERHVINEDYVFVRLLDEALVSSPMERVRSVYPNAMHVERKMTIPGLIGEPQVVEGRAKMDGLSLFKAFYKDVRGTELSPDTEKLFIETLQEILEKEGERYETVEADNDGVRAV